MRYKWISELRWEDLRWTSEYGIVTVHSVPFLHYASRHSRARKGTKIMSNVAKTLENNDFCIFFGVSLENALWRFWALKGPKLGSKKWSEINENRVLKRRLVRRRLGNLSWTENGATSDRDPRGRGSRKGGRGDGQIHPRLNFSKNSKFVFEERP